MNTLTETQPSDASESASASAALSSFPTANERSNAYVLWPQNGVWQVAYPEGSEYSPAWIDLRLEQGDLQTAPRSAAEEYAGEVITVWEYDDCPERFGQCAYRGGDEDYVAVVPNQFDPAEVPWLGDIGLCNVDMSYLQEFDVYYIVVGCHA